MKPGVFNIFCKDWRKSNGLAEGGEYDKLASVRRACGIPGSQAEDSYDRCKSRQVREPGDKSAAFNSLFPELFASWAPALLLFASLVVPPFLNSAARLRTILGIR